jgi:Protein of unknown function (DUF2917)
MSFESQPHSSVLSLPQGRPVVLRAASTWQLAHGGVVRVRAREAGVLRVSSGQAWVTMDRRRGDTLADAGDLFVSPGHDLPLRADQSLVLEAWPAGAQGSMGLSWEPVTQPARLVRTGTQPSTLRTRVSTWASALGWSQATVWR